MAGLLACPQLLSDDFGAVLDTGGDTCARRQTCASENGGSGSARAGSGGTTSGAGGSSANAGGSGGSAGDGEAGSAANAGSSGAADQGGTGGSGDAPDASVAPPESDSIPACWTIGLDDATHVASDNCLGINGWNAVETDPSTLDTTVSTSYSDDRVCFTGSIDNAGWGAVYNLTLNDTDPWNAASLGVGGFELAFVGTSLPPQMQVKYTDDSSGDYCRVITPAASVEVPFSIAHPGCSTSSSSVSDATDLTYIRLVMPAAASSYAIDFCLDIRAIP